MLVRFTMFLGACSGVREEDLEREMKSNMVNMREVTIAQECEEKKKDERAKNGKSAVR